MPLVSGRYGNSQVTTVGIRASEVEASGGPSHSGTSQPATILPSRDTFGCHNWESASGGTHAPGI